MELGGHACGREDLRRFILEEVLPHEIGHHVYHSRRRAQGLIHAPGTRESEQFAEAYAARYRQERGIELLKQR